MSLLDFIFETSFFQISAWGVVIFTAAFSLGLAWWVFRDISERTNNVVAQVVSTAGVLIFSIPGLIFYMLFRPNKTLAEEEIECLELSILRAEFAETEEAEKEAKRQKTSKKNAKK